MGKVEKKTGEELGKLVGGQEKTGQLDLLHWDTESDETEVLRMQEAIY